MTNIFNPRKPLFLAVFLSLAFLFGGSPAHAQTASDPATQGQVQDLEATIRALLTQLIAQLTQQLNDLMAQQTQTNQTVSNIQTSLQPTPVLGVATSSPVVSTPLKIVSGNAGSIVSYFQAQRYADTIDDGEKYLLTSSRIGVTTSKPIDISKTEVWVDGVKRDITVALNQAIPATVGYWTRFDISPSVYSFAQKTNGGYKASYQFKFSTVDGEQASSSVVSCEAYDTNHDGWMDWSTGCNNMPISQ